MKKASLGFVVVLIIEIMLSYFIPSNHYFSVMFSFLYTIYAALQLKEKPLVFCFICGFIYDVMLATYFLNAILFPVIFVIIRLLVQRMNDNILTSFLFSFILVILYRSLTYFTLVLTKYLIFSKYDYLQSIVTSLFLNLLFWLFLKKQKFYKL